MYTLVVLTVVLGSRRIVPTKILMLTDFSTGNAVTLKLVLDDVTG